MATRDGTVVGRGSAGPATRRPRAGGCSLDRRGGARGPGEHDPASVRSGVAGIAGAGIMADPGITTAFTVEWAQCGLTCPVTMVGDAVTAFAAGTSAPSGAVLIAGTGAVAARIDDRRVSRTADGLGWLLGDEARACGWACRRFARSPGPGRVLPWTPGWQPRSRRRPA
ncbi:hypothetical protein NKG94_50635 [Micromonospora sp. M12]